MTLRRTWTLTLLATGVTIGACATSDTGDYDEITTTGTTTGTVTGTPGGAATGTATGTPGGTATGTTTGTTTGSGTGGGGATGGEGGGATGGQGGFGGDSGGAGGAGAATGGGGGALGGSGGGTGGSGGGGASALSCFSPSDCTSTATDICDVETETCQPTECDPSTTQPAGCTGTDPYCLEQHSLSGIGACYELCDPFDTACPSGYECVTNNVGQDLGVCHQPGAGTTGSACNPTPNPADEWMTSSGCALGNLCLDAGGGSYECFQTCDFFGAPTCNGATVCYPWGYCDTPVGGSQDSVAVNATCNGASGGELCGLTGGRDGYAGQCEDLGDGLNMVCHAFCDAAGNYSCQAPTDTCYDVFSDPWSGHVGLCAQPPGSGCTQASDCTDPTSEICDVDTETCQASECDPAQAQPGGCTGTDPICMEQSASSGIGACYEQCDPFDVACPGSFECRNNTYGQDWGLCLNAGSGTTGNTCSPMTGTDWGTTTGCVAGNICMSNTCWEVCDFWGSPTCAGSTVCHLFGFCDAPTGGGYDAVDVGDACSGASGGEDCGLVSGHDGYQGACNDLGDGLGMICRPYCTTADNPCAALPFDGVCYDVFQPPLEGQVGTCIM